MGGMIRRWVIAGIAAIVVTVGCASTPPPPPDAGPPVGRWPSPTTAVDTHGPTRWLAASEVFLGSRERAGSVRSTAWMRFGFNLDGRVTSTADSAKNTGVCLRHPDAPKSINGDGIDGVDNAFGSQLFPILKSLQSDLEDLNNEDMRAGKWTMVLKIDDLGADDDASAPGTLLLVADLGHPATFTAADRWPVVRTLGAFPHAYVAHGQWVSGFARTTFPLLVAFRDDGGLLRLSLEPGLVVLDLGSGKTTVAGVLPMSSLVGSTETTVRVFGGCRSDRDDAGRLSTTTDSMLSSVVEAADLVAGAPDFQDPTAQCNAASFGIGLTMASTGEPSGTAPWPEVPDRCGRDSEAAGP